MQRNGFTLIELLVVIAIIAILAAILFAFSAARAKQKDHCDISNLRQIMLAVQMYSDDHDELAPPETPCGDDVAWLQYQIMPYVKEQRHLLRPAQAACGISALYVLVGIPLG